MYKVAVVLYEGCYLSSLTGPIDAFQIANAHIKARKGQDLAPFTWQTVSMEAGPVETSGGFNLSADVTIDNAEHFDFIYIPAFLYKGSKELDSMLQKMAPLIDWLRRCWKGKAILGSNCTGTFILAQTGLLNGRKATTTWWLEQAFRARFGEVNLQLKSMVTEQDRLICSGAMTANMNMALHIIEKQVSSELAVQCAKTMLIDTSDNIQSPYHNLLTRDSSQDPVVAKTQYWLHSHLHVNIDQVRLAKKMGVSQRTLIRRFKSELNVTPITYLQNARIETAKKILENTSTPLHQVVEQVGYNDLSSFSKLFKKRVGLTPMGYRQRFSKRLNPD